MAEVFPFPDKGTALGKQPRTRTLSPANVAAGLAENVGSLDMLLVLGVREDGRLYAASTHPDIADTILLLDRMRRKLLSAFGEDEFS